jgi:Leucine-rich repeat (LRR) protein
VNFPKLKELDLSSNRIRDIKFLEEVNFGQLRELSLRDNKIVEKENTSIINYLKSKIKDFHI